MNHPDFVQILGNVPRWVFLVFFLLIYMGYKQSKDREVSLPRLFITPLVMAAISLSGIISFFGVTLVPIMAWGLGAALMTTVGPSLWSQPGAYDGTLHKFHVPGSWLPLILMMAIFVTKFAVNVVYAGHLEVASWIGLPMLTGLVLGGICGMFAARVRGNLRTNNQAAPAAEAG